MNGDTVYAYCPPDNSGWELKVGETASRPLSAATIFHLCATEALSEQQGLRRVGDEEWSDISSCYYVVKREAYGELLPKIFKSNPHRMWFYEGLSGDCQGPYTNEQMFQWYNGGYLCEQTKICAVSNSRSMPSSKQLFCTIEEMLLYVSQPLFPSTSACRDPLTHLQSSGGRRISMFAMLEKQQQTSGLPRSHPTVELNPLPSVVGELEDKDSVESVRSAISSLRSMAARLFCFDRKKLWYYIGQSEDQHIHGPFSGDWMFSWFQQGWLSESMLIWSTLEEIVHLDRQKFETLGSLLNSQRYP